MPSIRYLLQGSLDELMLLNIFSEQIAQTFKDKPLDALLTFVRKSIYSGEYDELQLRPSINEMVRKVVEDSTSEKVSKEELLFWAIYSMVYSHNNEWNNLPNDGKLSIRYVFKKEQYKIVPYWKVNVHKSSFTSKIYSTIATFIEHLGSNEIILFHLDSDDIIRYIGLGLTHDYSFMKPLDFGPGSYFTDSVEYLDYWLSESAIFRSLKSVCILVLKLSESDLLLFDKLDLTDITACNNFLRSTLKVVGALPTLVHEDYAVGPIVLNTVTITRCAPPRYFKQDRQAPPLQYCFVSTRVRIHLLQNCQMYILKLNIG